MMYRVTVPKRSIFQMSLVILCILLTIFIVLLYSQNQIYKPPFISISLNEWKNRFCNCNCPKTFSAWKKGVITELEPKIHRNCHRLFIGNASEEELKLIQKENEIWKPPPPSQLVSATNNCTWVQEEFFNNLFTTSKEFNFPLAFVLITYDSPYQVMRLLKVIYRPHNLYCIHVDKKANHETIQIFKNIANCLANIIVPAKTLDVVWGWHTLMDAQMSCFSDLLPLRHFIPWEYVITLCGKELPLRTNTEIVALLEPLKDTSALQVGDGGMDQWKFENNKKWVLNKNNKPVLGKAKLGPIPHNFKLYRSMVYFAFTPSFTDFILHNSTAIELHKYMNNVMIPEENFYAILYKLPGTPGGYNSEVNHLIPESSTYIWLTGGWNKEWWKHCSGKNVHDICIISAKDISRLSYKPILGKRGPFFHNKYFMEYDNTAMDCMEEEIVSRNKAEYMMECHSD